jgi:mono/diheme cytochrome c family protein
MGFGPTTRKDVAMNRAAKSAGGGAIQPRDRWIRRGLRHARLTVQSSGCLFLLALSGGLASGEGLKFTSAEDSRAEYERSVKPFLARHCVECHGVKDPEGQLDVNSLDPDMKSGADGSRWAMLVAEVKSGEMPPKEKQRPTAESIEAVLAWASAETKRANKAFTKREAYDNGNQTPHASLFDPKNIPPFDGEARVRRLRPEIYAKFLKTFAKDRRGVNQPFSPAGGTTFRDMGDPKIDEPASLALLENALIIVEKQTEHTVDGGKIVKSRGAKELMPLFDPAAPPTDPQIEAAIKHQFQKALSRQPTADELGRFTQFMKRNIAETGQVAGARYALAAVFMLPEAVFRMEVGSGQPDAKGRVRLAPREIAYSLAYALSDTGPDPELLAAAATGGLDSDEGVARQVERMLANSKLEKPRIMGFFREYFGYDKAPDVFKEMNGGGGARDFGGHNAHTLVADTDRLVEYILEQDRDVLRELLTTNKSFVAYKSAAESKKQIARERVKFQEDAQKNPEKFKNKVFRTQVKLVYEAYGLEDFPDQQPIELPPDQRAGILTQPSWLVANSTTLDNHAIHRGKWIRERLLGNVVPDVPITVDAQLPIAPEKTLRERMAVTEQAYCWQCHQLMNDLAYPFEQYDHFGRFRKGESVLDPEATAKNVDKKGKSLGPVMRDAPLRTDGLVAHVGDPALEGPVSGPVELVKRLASSERVEQVFVRHAFRFWLGRNESPGDAATLQAMHKAYRASGGSMKALLTAILASESFLYRVPAQPEPNASAQAAPQASGS